MMNVKNHAIYSNNFILNVLDLTQIELATEEDKQFQIDYWAKLFKSNTWEELKAMQEDIAEEKEKNAKLQANSK